MKYFALGLCALSAYGQSGFLPGGLTRFAGRDLADYTGDSGPARYALFRSASALALDSAGNLYIGEAARIRKIDTRGIVTTIAGTGELGSTGDGGPATLAQVRNPGSIAFDSRGNLYFSQAQLTIRRIATDGTITTIAGNGFPHYNGEGLEALMVGMGPAGLAFDAADQLYFADPMLQRLRVIRSDGRVYTVAGTGVSGSAGEGGPAAMAQLHGPYDVAFDAAGNLLVADGPRVVRIDARGMLTRVREDFLTASTIAPVPAGDIFVAGPEVKRITSSGLVFSITGPACLSTVSVTARSIRSDAAGNLYLLVEDGRVIRMPPGGGRAVIAGYGPNLFTGDGGPASQATFAVPSGIAFDRAGRLYMADTNNNRIRMIDTSGTVRTVAGEGGPAFDSDPPCPDTVDDHLSRPQGVAVDGDGNIYVADTGKHRVRKVAPDGSQSTIAVALNQPSGVAADLAGNLFIGDWGNQRVLRVDRAGTVITILDRVLPGLLSFNRAGELLIPIGNEVLRLRADGMLLPVTGTGEPGVPSEVRPETLDQAVSVVSDADGFIYVADLQRRVIQRTSPNCAITAADLPQTSRPVGLAFDTQGNLYIADSAANAIWKAAPAMPSNREAPTPRLAIRRPVRSAAPLLAPLPQANRFDPRPLSGPEPVAPGELIRIRGACLGPFDPVVASFDPNGKLPTSLGNVQATLNGVPVPLISVSSGDVVGVVPFGLQATAPGSVSIAYRSVMDSGLAPIATATPALFTSNLSPSGPAIALNQDGSLNSVTNPARKGSVVVLYGTGTGETEPISVSGQAAPLTPLHVVRLPLTAKIGGADTEVLFAGAAPGFVGLTQFNVRVPQAAAGRGPVRVEITVGGVPLNQTLVTIAIE